ncbi:hypothetical protein Tco_0697309 [Tanacetum coccineum]
MKDSLSAKPQRVTSDGFKSETSWKTLMFEESQGWQYPEDILPFEEEQAELVLSLFLVYAGQSNKAKRQDKVLLGL